MTVFDGQKALWMWEFSRQAEQTLAAACSAAQALAGAGILLVKLMDGMDWMQRYDAAGYGSAAQFQSDAAAAAAAGVTVVPWVVPHGVNPAGEAAAHAQLGPVLMLDVEPYPGFWTGPAANLRVYLQALRAGGVQELHLAIDPRASAVAALGGAAAWSGLVDAVHPQVYWTTFGVSAAEMLPLIRGLLPSGPGGSGAGASLVYPVLPGDGAAQDLADVWTLAQAAGCAGVSIWRLGSMDAAQLAAFKALAVAPADVSALAGRVTALEASVAGLAAAVDRLNAVLVKRFEAVRVALDPANPPA